jgi:group II intron reverse transcriptase/maturase/CRISPR-associated endonuclease Cas1
MPYPAFERYAVTLTLRAPVRLHFNHGGAVMGLLCHALGRHPLPAGVIPATPESGTTRFEPGERYRFGVTLAGEARDHSRRLRAGLKQASEQAPAEGAVFGGNFDLDAVERLPDLDLDADVERLRAATAGTQPGTHDLTLRLTSPLRLKRPDELQVKGAAFVNAECFPAAHFLERLFRRLFFLDLGHYPALDDERAQTAGSDAQAVDARLTWLDLPIPGHGDAARPKGYTLGGVQGSVRLTQVPAAWLPWLVAGQHLHAGENTHYGLGRYLIRELGERDAFTPARSAFDTLTDVKRLDQALDHVVERSDMGGVDHVTPQEFAEERDERLPKLAEDLRTGRYRLSALLGIIDRKPTGGLRALVVPTVGDRVAQRAAIERWGPAIDTLLEDCAYAYRKGFSRAGAARAVQRAYEEGYRYVLDADVRAFYDEVPWDRLEAKLEALFPFEPLTRLVMEWVKAPVVFEGRTLTRTRGLPQGSPLSPLLANLYLDELDEELLGHDYRLVRYADDFVVLAKDLDTARRARDDAQQALARLGLALNDHKTEIRSVNDGFKYLGYLFCRSVVLDSPRQPDAVPKPLEPSAVPAHSWLAKVPFEHVRELMSRPRRKAKAVVEVVPLARAKPAVSDGRVPLHVLTPATKLWLREDALMVEPPGVQAKPVPMTNLSHVVLCGKVRATLPVVLSLGQRGVPVYFCRRSGELYGVYAAPAPQWDLWAAQGRAVADPALCLAFAREIVAAKLHNTAFVATRFKLTGAAAAADELRELARSCENKSEVETLRGVEGRGAAVYFGALRATLASEWGFSGRHARPAPDPVNALLSFGYTLLYHHVSTALIAAGLNPRLGLFHRERGAYHALACDLQEELRFRVDGLVLSLIHRRELRPSDFGPSPDGRYPCLLTHDARKRYVAAFEERLTATVTPPGGEPTTYRAFIDAQARSVRTLVQDGAPAYAAYRARSTAAGVSPIPIAGDEWEA